MRHINKYSVIFLLFSWRVCMCSTIFFHGVAVFFQNLWNHDFNLTMQSTLYTLHILIGAMSHRVQIERPDILQSGRLLWLFQRIWGHGIQGGVFSLLVQRDWEKVFVCECVRVCACAAEREGARMDRDQEPGLFVLMFSVTLCSQWWDSISTHTIEQQNKILRYISRRQR